MATYLCETVIRANVLAPISKPTAVSQSNDFLFFLLRVCWNWSEGDRHLGEASSRSEINSLNIKASNLRISNYYDLICNRNNHQF